MSTYDILDTVYECYDHYVPVSYKSLINTLEYHNIPFSHNVYELSDDIRTPNDCFTYKTRMCAVEINIELYSEGSRIVITMINDNITEIRRELSMANMFMNCTSLENLTF